jgi:hypothetical protein
MANVAYLVLTHGLPYQTIDFLWSVWREEDTYFIHLDGKSPAQSHAAIGAIAAAFPNIHVVPPTICTWGGFSLVEAAMRCLQTALATNESWSHAVLVSGNHVPLRRASDFAEMLEPGRSYLTLHDIDLASARLEPPNWFSGIARRFIYKHYEVPGLGDIRGGFRKAPANVTFFWGSQWWILSRPAVEFVCQSRQSPLANYLQYVAIPDESYFQTVLANSPLKDRLTHIQIIWQQWGSDGRPRFLSDGDLRAAMASKQLFARKADLAVMRDGNGIVANQIATRDRLDWKKSVVAAFTKFLPPETARIVRKQYLHPEVAAPSDYEGRQLATASFLAELSGIIQRHAERNRLVVQLSRSNRDGNETILTCRFPAARTKAKYLLIVRICLLEVAWAGLYVRSKDVAHAFADLRNSNDLHSLDLSLPGVRGFHPHHDVLRFALRRKGVVSLSRSDAIEKLDRIIASYLDILTKIPGVVKTGPKARTKKSAKTNQRLFQKK